MKRPDRLSRKAAWRRTGEILLVPTVGVLNAVLNFAAVVVATRSGHLADIAAYAVGVSGSALAAVLASGGTTLTYVNGSDDERAAVKRLRRRFTGPLLIAFAIGFGVLYASVTQLSVLPLLFGGLAVMFNNSSELASVDLQRAGRTVFWGAAVILARGGAICGLLLGMTYSLAMLLSSVALAALAWAAAPKEYNEPTTPLRAVYSLNLLGLSALNVLILRLPFLAMPYLFSADELGALTVILTGQQAITAVLTRGLYAVMTARAKSESGEPLLRWVEALIQLASVLTLLGVLMYADLLMGLMGVQDHAPHWWLGVLVATTPLIVRNRTYQFRLLHERNERTAVGQLGVICSVVMGLIIVAIWSGEEIIFLLAPVAGEASALLVATMRRFMTRVNSA